MQGSITYQGTLQEAWNQGVMEGRILQAKRCILIVARRRFPEPGPAILAAIEAIQDIDRLEVLFDLIVDRVLEREVADWDEVLGIA